MWQLLLYILSFKLTPSSVNNHKLFKAKKGWQNANRRQYSKAHLKVVKRDFLECGWQVFVLEKRQGQNSKAVWGQQGGTYLHQPPRWPKHVNHTWMRSITCTHNNTDDGDEEHYLLSQCFEPSQPLRTVLSWCFEPSQPLRTVLSCCFEPSQALRIVLS